MELALWHTVGSWTTRNIIFIMHFFMHMLIGGSHLMALGLAEATEGDQKERMGKSSCPPSGQQGWPQPEMLQSDFSPSRPLSLDCFTKGFSSPTAYTVQSQAKPTSFHRQTSCLWLITFHLHPIGTDFSRRLELFFHLSHFHLRLPMVASLLGIPHCSLVT